MSTAHAHRARTSSAVLVLATALFLVLFATSGQPAAAAPGAPAAQAATATNDTAGLRRQARRQRVRMRAACSRAARVARRDAATDAQRRRAARRCRVLRARARRARARLAAAYTTADRRVAPVLRVSGTTVSWARVADVNRYVLATKLPNKATTYRIVTGTSVTPPAAPGQRVNYGLRTDVSGSAWAREVSITYPSTTGTAPTAPAPGGAFEMGVVSGSDRLNEAKVSGKLGAKLVRVEWRVGTPAADMRTVIATHAANGTRVLPLAGFHARMPTVDEARNLGAWAREFGPGGTFWAGRADGHLAVREIEFGNETSYGYQYGDNWDKPSYSARAREYALRLKDAHVAIQAANPRVGLLGQIEDANTGSRNWINGVFEAVPDVAKRVTGWTIHPYGPRSRWEPRMDRLLAWTAEKGAPSTLPMWVTEWGLASDNGRCLSDNYGWDKCMTYATAAGAVTSTVADMRAKYGSRLRSVFLYQGRDQVASGTSTNREHYFGALRGDMTDKGTYSGAVRALLAGS